MGKGGELWVCIKTKLEKVPGPSGRKLVEWKQGTVRFQYYDELDPDPEHWMRLNIHTATDNCDVRTWP